MEYDKSKLIKKDKYFVSSSAKDVNGSTVLFSTKPKIATKKSKKKFTWLFLVINIVIVAAIFIYQFGFHETKPLSELFAEKPFYRFFFISLGLLVVYYLALGISYSVFLKRATGRFRFFLGVELAVVGKYWDNITPFGTGGQFAQVSYSKKYGVPSEKATSIVISKYMIGMVALTITGIAVLFVPITTFTSGTVIKIMASVGIGINILLTLFVWLVSVNKKMCSFLVVGGLKLLHKMKIVKDYNKALYKTLRFIRQYQKAFAYYLKNPFIFIAQVLLSLIELIAMALVAYMVYLAFNPNGTISPVTIVAMSFLCSFATSFIPLPGGSGAAEISFAALFSQLFSESAVFWALIFWRILTFYVVVLIGFIFTLSEPAVYNAIEKKKQEKNKNPS